MLFFLCLNFGFYEYSVIKKYNENINMAICCMSSALFAVLWSIKFSKEIQSVNMNVYRPYAQVGIIIFMFMAGIFTCFIKKEKSNLLNIRYWMIMMQKTKQMQKNLHL